MKNGEYESELFTITMEECAEVIQSCSKILRFGFSPENLDALEKEIGDLYCMIDLMQEKGYISFSKIDIYSQNKIEKLKNYSNLFGYKSEE